jgi:hypothetical protein
MWTPVNDLYIIININLHREQYLMFSLIIAWVVHFTDNEFFGMLDERNNNLKK